MPQSSSIPGIAGSIWQGAPEEIYWDMYYDDIGFDDAASKYANQTEIDAMELGGPGTIEDDDPFAVEKATYQRGIINNRTSEILSMNPDIDPDEAEMRAASTVSGILTPYGPGLLDDEVDALYNKYPGMDALSGVTVGDWDDVFSEAEKFENREDVSYQLDSIVNEVETAAAQGGFLDNLWDELANVGNKIGDMLGTNVAYARGADVSVGDYEDMFYQALPPANQRDAVNQQVFNELDADLQDEGIPAMVAYLSDASEWQQGGHDAQAIQQWIESKRGQLGDGVANMLQDASEQGQKEGAPDPAVEASQLNLYPETGDDPYAGTQYVWDQETDEYELLPRDIVPVDPLVGTSITDEMPGGMIAPTGGTGELPELRLDEGQYYDNAGNPWTPDVTDPGPEGALSRIFLDQKALGKTDAEAYDRAVTWTKGMPYIGDSPGDESSWAQEGATGEPIYGWGDAPPPPQIGLPGGYPSGDPFAGTVMGGVAKSYVDAPWDPTAEDMFDRAYNRIPGSATQLAQNQRNSYYNEADALYHLMKPWNTREWAPEAEALLDIQSKKNQNVYDYITGARSDTERPEIDLMSDDKRGEYKQKETANFGEWSDEYLDDPQIQRSGDAFSTNMENFVRDIQRFDGASVKDILDTEGDLWSGYVGDKTDLLVQHNEIVGNPRDNRAPTLAALYNTPAGASLNFKNSQHRLFEKMYSEWIAEGRTPESFLKTFITRRPPAPAPPHGTMAGTHGM